MTKEEPQYKKINIDKLKLDPLNPRLPKSYKNKTEKDIIEYMLLDASLIELMLAIGTNDFFSGEQLLVVKDNKDEMYKVIEGNRRLSAVKLLNYPNLALIHKNKIEQVIAETDKRPTEIPCLIFNSESDIHIYLGFRHITGIKEWNLLSKANYLYGLFNNHQNEIFDNTCREIAKIIGSRKDYVRRVIIGYEVYKIIEDEGFYKIKGLDDTSFYFNYILDSLNKENIRNFIGIDFELEKPAENIHVENLKIWTTWFFKENDQGRTRLIGNSDNLHKLNKILGSPEALKAFKDDGVELNKAFELTNDLGDIFFESLKKSLQYLEQADNVVHKIQDFYSNLDEDIKNIKRLASKIQNTKNSILDEEKF